MADTNIDDSLAHAIENALAQWECDDDEVCKAISRNLRTPEQNQTGRLVGKRFMRVNGPIETLAASLCKIEPHHRVLEVGFGPGLGLKAALSFMTNGSGQLHGVDLSERMIDLAKENLQAALTSGQLTLHLGSVTKMPFDSDMFDKVFHTNTFYFWDDMDEAVNEIKRVMKSGSLIVCCYNKARLEKVNHTPFMQYGNMDVNRYKDSLERCGFVDIRIEEHFINDDLTLHSIQATAQKKLHVSP